MRSLTGAYLIPGCFEFVTFMQLSDVYEKGKYTKDPQGDSLSNDYYGLLIVSDDRELSGEY